MTGVPNGRLVASRLTTPPGGHPDDRGTDGAGRDRGVARQRAHDLPAAERARAHVVDRRAGDGGRGLGPNHSSTAAAGSTPLCPTSSAATWSFCVVAPGPVTYTITARATDGTVLATATTTLTIA